MAIGNKGVTKSILSGARLTIYLTVPLRVLSIILGDQPTMHRIVGTVATDILKISISAVLAKAAATAVGAVVTSAFGPIVIAVVVGVGAAMVLDALDDKFGLTEKLISGLEEADKKTFGWLAEQIVQYNQSILDQVKRGKAPTGWGINY